MPVVLACNMKLFIAFLICTGAVFGESSFSITKIREMLKDSTNACIRELRLDPKLINEKRPATDAILYNDPNFMVCLDKKMGLLNEDATYNLNRLLSFATTPEDRERAKKAYSTEIKECTLKAGKDFCKAAACVHDLPEHLCTKKTIY